MSNERRKVETGQVYGNLIVFEILPGSPRRALVHCKAPCNYRLIVYAQYLLRKPNPVTHCGCQGNVGGARRKTHLKAGGNTLFRPEYRVWKNMVRRCHDPAFDNYPQYGGKGIVVAERWRDEKYGFQNFVKDVGLRPSPFYSLDRIDPYGNYELSNVRWATAKEQARNKKQTRYCVHPETGARVKVADLADELGVPYYIVKYRIDQGEIKSA